MKANEDNDEETSSQQNNIWKQIQAKAKPLLSPKLGARNNDQKRERGMWMFKRKKKKENDLDRVISSSQPDLFLSAPVVCDGEESPLCSTADPGYFHRGSVAEEMHVATERQICVGSSSPKHTVSYLVQSHHKSSSLGSACLEKLVLEQVHSDTGVDDRSCGDAEKDKETDAQPGAAAVEPTSVQPSSCLYKLELHLKRGFNLAVRDRGGTSDPYVKLKLCGKEVFRSRTIHKNLNPTWDEKTTLLLDSLQEPLYVKVFDYDFGRQDDFMGSAYLYLESLEQQRTVPVSLTLKDPTHPDQDLGTLEFTATLTPKHSPLEEHADPATMLLRRSWKRSAKQHQQSLRLFDLHRKAQLWRGIVSISLIEGRDLIPMDPNGLSDPYAKFRLGPQKYRSKTMPKTLCPQWREQFDLHMYEETGGLLEVTVWDKDTGIRDDFMGRCQLDLSTLAREHTHRLELPLEESRGSLVLLVTLTASASDPASADPRKRQHLRQRYGLLRSFSDLRDVGIVQVKVLRAEGLMAADVNGKSDPFCVLELNNDRLQTHTVYKNLNPEWNKVFTLKVKDIHSVLEVTVFDEDRDRSADFLGKIAIPLLHIQNGVRKAYVLKNKELTRPSKGVVFLESEVIYNAVKAGLRTVSPLEQKYIEEEPRVSKQLLQRNFTRVKRCIVGLLNMGAYINSCFEWECPQRSVFAFLLFVVVVWNFEVYMLPLALLLLLAWNYVAASGREPGTTSTEAASFEWEQEEEEEREDKDAERRGFMERLYALQDVCVSVQNALDQGASHAERVRNTFNWTVPFLSLLAMTALCVATVLLFLIPLRYLVLIWGVNKFTKKLRNPYTIDNNELLDFLSRVPSDVQVMRYRELRVDPGQSPNKRKRTNPS